MKNKKCPICGKYTYKEWEGSYDEGKKISPDFGKCKSCGFIYDESLEVNNESQDNYISQRLGFVGE